MAKICIYGAGSIGCYVGGRLLAGGSDVTFIARERVGRQLREHGLTLSQFGERRLDEDACQHPPRTSGEESQQR